MFISCALDRNATKQKKTLCLFSSDSTEQTGLSAFRFSLNIPFPYLREKHHNDGQDAVYMN